MITPTSLTCEYASNPINIDTRRTRFGVGHGSPTTWKTYPQRYRRHIDFMRSKLASITPPH